MKEYTVGVKKLKEPVSIKNPAAVAELLGELRQAEVEIVTVVHVGKDMMAREIELCAIGSMMSVSVEARTIFAHAASDIQDRSIVIAHNHAFQKHAEPSTGDREFLHGIKMAASVMGIPIHDSVILGTKSHYSFMEHGVLYEKSDTYHPLKWEDWGGINSRISMPDVDRRITSHKHAVDLASFIRKEPGPVTAVIHLTPDMEPTMIVVYDFDHRRNSKGEARHVLRRAVINPSTKYLILLSNLGMFEKSHKAEESVLECLKYTRLGAMVLCIPVLDMIMVNEKDHYSFSEDGKVFPKCRRYAMVEDEGIKMKGVSKVHRADVPPYSYTFR